MIKNQKILRKEFNMKSKSFSQNIWINIIAIIAILLLAVNVTPANDKMDKTSKSTFLIKLPHTPESCLSTLDDIKNEDPSVLKKIKWGCMSGDHTGYLITEAKSKEDALNLLPSTERKEAQVIMVTKFSVKDIENIHKSHK
jgi:hypothetical protein